MLNFYQLCKTPPSAFSEKHFSDDPQFFARFRVEPLVIYNCALYNWKLSHRLRDIRLLSIPWPWNPGYGSLKFIEIYKTKSGTHDFQLTFHSHHRPISHCFRDVGHFRWKSPIFPTPCIYSPDEGVLLGIWYRRKGSRMLLWWCYQMVEKVLR